MHWRQLYCKIFFISTSVAINNNYDKGYLLVLFNQRAHNPFKEIL